MCCEAVVFFDKRKEREAMYRLKRCGHLLEKSRFISCQLIGYLGDHAWIKAACQANTLAAKFAKEVQQIEGCSIVSPVSTNLVFVEIPKALLDGLVQEGM